MRKHPTPQAFVLSHALIIWFGTLSSARAVYLLHASWQPMILTLRKSSGISRLRRLAEVGSLRALLRRGPSTRSWRNMGFVIRAFTWSALLSRLHESARTVFILRTGSSGLFRIIRVPALTSGSSTRESPPIQPFTSSLLCRHVSGSELGIPVGADVY